MVAEHAGGRFCARQPLSSAPFVEAKRRFVERADFSSKRKGRLSKVH
jgi:hypothetical protein